MPKVLIKEYDGSTAGAVASDNFAVVVPGYLGNAKDGYNRDELLIDCDIYEIKSQKQFVDYIGRMGGLLDTAKESPILQEINPTGATIYEKCYRNLIVNDFYITNGSIYAITELDEDNALYGKEGYLLKTFSWVETEEIKEPQDDGEGGTVEVVVETKYHTRQVTIQLTKVEGIKDVELIYDENTGLQITKSNKYCIIETGNEGKDEIDSTQIGNQIAYELLGLGYTVLYKALDENKSLESQLCEADFWEPLKDKAVFNFRYITTGGYYNPAAMNQIVKLATFINGKADLNNSETLVENSNGRGDCIALCDIDEERFGISSNLTMRDLAKQFGSAASVITESPFAAIFAPRVTYKLGYSETESNDFNNNNTFPASFHYLACAARAFERYNEWYAVAGYARGISKYDVANTSVKVGEILVNTLAPRIDNGFTAKAINFILHEKGNYFLWGNRTANKLDTKIGLRFHHFLNIRQLCCSIKKQLYTACRQFTFDPNSDLLWINFVNAIKPTLEAMKADQGIKGYTITRAANSEKAMLTAKIRIVPIEAVEDFDISIYLEDTITGIDISAEETQA